MNQDAIALAIAGVMPAARASGLDVSVCTIQVPSGALTDNGFPDGTYVDVAGLVDLACQVAPTSIARISANTTKLLSEQESCNTSHVLFYDYLPQIETAWRNGGRAVIDGEIYSNQDIMGVESDSQNTQTRMTVRVETI